MQKDCLYSLTLVFAILIAAPAAARTDTAPVSSETFGGDLGTVRLPVACSEAAHPHAREGLALLHHMTYEGARAAFAAATAADPGCALGYWGQAMSYIHPLWSDPPAEAEFERGRELAERAEVHAEALWEQAYIAAVQAYYEAGRSDDERPNLVAFETGWRQAHEALPEDPEAGAFHALAHLATADPADKAYSRQKRAAGIARQVLDAVPEHPGAHHYTIHAYDYPPLAADALKVARSYGEIAPRVPHALHMPSHIFIRLGLWSESITMNRRSAEAALEHPADGQVSLHYLHALDYLAYAHLQRAEHVEAQAVLEELRALEGPVQPHVASAYALAAVPARLALERHHWAEAIALEPRTPASFPWDRYPAMEAITHFARALGAAMSGTESQTREALDNLSALRDEAGSGYWADQIDIQHMAAQAWLRYQQGKPEEALARMQQAVQMEAATEKHPVTPGEVLPAQELLGDMLRAQGNYHEAQQAYGAALARSPKRFNSLYGFGRAAELAGEAATAERYYRRLLDSIDENAADPRLLHVRGFLAER